MKYFKYIVFILSVFMFSCNDCRKLHHETAKFSTDKLSCENDSNDMHSEQIYDTPQKFTARSPLEAYNEAYDTGYEDGHEAGVDNNDIGYYDDSCPYKGSMKKKYEEGYKYGYKNGNDDGFEKCEQSKDI